MDWHRDLPPVDAQPMAEHVVDYAHVLDESIDTRRNASTGEAWLRGRFTYMLYR